MDKPAVDQISSLESNYLEWNDITGYENKEAPEQANEGWHHGL